MNEIIYVNKNMSDSGSSSGRTVHPSITKKRYNEFKNMLMKEYDIDEDKTESIMETFCKVFNFDSTAKQYNESRLNSTRRYRQKQKGLSS